MSEVTTTFEVSASPEAVYAALTDFDGYAQWLAIHKGWVDALPNQVAAGSTLTQKIKVSGVPGEVKWKVEIAQTPAHFAMTGVHSKGSQLALTWHVEEAAEGSVVRFKGGMTDVPRPLQPMINKQFRESMETSHGRLRELLGGS